MGLISSWTGTADAARVLPRSVVYDAELTLTLPAGLSATSGMNAIAHAVEGLYAPDATPSRWIPSRRPSRLPIPCPGPPTRPLHRPPDRSPSDHS